MTNSSSITQETILDTVEMHVEKKAELDSRAGEKEPHATTGERKGFVASVHQFMEHHKERREAKRREKSLAKFREAFEGTFGPPESRAKARYVLKVVDRPSHDEEVKAKESERSRFPKLCC